MNKKNNNTNNNNNDDDNDNDDDFDNNIDSLYDDYYYKYKYEDGDESNYKGYGSNKHNELDMNWTNTRPMQPAEYYIALIRKQHDFMLR